jgi:hypothetical protein
MEKQGKVKEKTRKCKDTTVTATMAAMIIPDICHMHHMRCRCQIFQPGVKISRIYVFLMFFGVLKSFFGVVFWCQIFELKMVLVSTK